MDEALVYDGDLGSIDVWRRGIADVEAHSVATSVDGEFITPEAARQKRERVKEYERAHRVQSNLAGSASSEATLRRVRSVRSDTTIRRKDVSKPNSSKVAVSDTGRTERSLASSESKKTKEVVLKERKSKKSSAIGVLFKRSKAKKEREREASLTLRPKVIEL